MKQVFLITFLFLTGIAGAWAQYYTNQNKVWAFGNGAGLNFTTGVPVPFASGVHTGEGTATLCDPAGNLLFYTDGKTVYNRTGSLMPSGVSIVPWSTSSTTQAAVVIPVISNPSRYYIFSLETDGVLRASRLAYSIVDMTLDGGMGDLVPGFIGRPMDSSMSEKMVAIQGNSCNVWLLTHRQATSQFQAYNITAAGISAPIVSTFSTPTSYYNGIGAMMCSPDRLNLVMQYNLSVSRGSELYNFDPATGIVSNRRVLDNVNMYYGAEFSPDNTKLYSLRYNNAGLSNLLQYDITLPTTAAIIASVDTITYGIYGGATQLRIGPDGKIYMMSFTDAMTNFLDVIEHPNLPGLSCGYTTHAVSLSPGTNGSLGLPSVYMSTGYTITGYTLNDTMACLSSVAGINIYPHGTAAFYIWYDGDSATSHYVTSPGTYWVEERNGCTGIIDSIHVFQLMDTAYGHMDTGVCVYSDYDSFAIKAHSGTNVTWFNGSTDSTIVVHHQGDFWVWYTEGCTRHMDTMHVHFNNAPVPILGPDSICAGSTAMLTDPTSGGTWTSSLTGIATIGAADGVVNGIAAGITGITYTIANGCPVSKSLKVLPLPCINGINQTTLASPEPSLFPIPANNECTISLNTAIFHDAAIKIYNVTGKLMMSYQLNTNTTTISIAALPSGMYQCTIEASGNILTRKKLAVIR